MAIINDGCGNNKNNNEIDINNKNGNYRNVVGMSTGIIKKGLQPKN